MGLGPASPWIVATIKGPPYAETMDAAWYLPTALAVLFAACIVMGLFSADSRPGFSDGRTDVKDRWFVHSRDDYR